jgi:hypothetical protein
MDVRMSWLVFWVLACEPQPPVMTPASPQVAVTAEPEEDGCRRDIPDCSAACALRATHHTEFIDWYDRRCAAVILGKNPDRVAGVAPPELDPDASRFDDLLANPYR